MYTVYCSTGEMVTGDLRWCWEESKHFLRDRVGKSANSGASFYKDANAIFYKDGVFYGVLTVSTVTSIFTRAYGEMRTIMKVRFSV